MVRALAAWPLIAVDGAVAAQRDGAAAQVQGIAGVPDEVAVPGLGVVVRVGDSRDRGVEDAAGDRERAAAQGRVVVDVQGAGVERDAAAEGVGAPQGELPPPVLRNAVAGAADIAVEGQRAGR